MQKQELTTQSFLAIQATYDGIELALCDNGHVRGVVSLHKFDASRLLIITIDQLLTDHSLKTSDLAFIAVNQGPGPFTTLRTVLATVNGIAFAAGVPLIGIDGLAAFLHEVAVDGVTVVVLNAFNKDVYYGIRSQDRTLEYGCSHGAILIAQLAAQFPGQDVTVAGNGVDLWRSELEQQFGNHLNILESVVTVSISQIAKLAYAQWQTGTQGMPQLMPLYLKQYSAIMGK